MLDRMEFKGFEAVDGEKLDKQTLAEFGLNPNANYWFDLNFAEKAIYFLAHAREQMVPFQTLKGIVSGPESLTLSINMMNARKILDDKRDHGGRLEPSPMQIYEWYRHSAYMLTTRCENLSEPRVLNWPEGVTLNFDPNVMELMEWSLTARQFKDRGFEYYFRTPFSKKETRLLANVAWRYPNICPNPDLIRSVWPNEDLSYNGAMKARREHVNPIVTRINAKLRQEFENKYKLQSIPGEGYLLMINRVSNYTS